MGLFVREVRIHPTAGRRPDPVDLLVAADRIAAIRPIGELQPGPDDAVLEGEGRFLSPPLVDPHVHMDAVLTVGEPRHNESGTLIEG
ncbi:MAG: cytosine deaminase, partial [Chloroflexota bacterium]